MSRGQLSKCHSLGCMISFPSATVWVAWSAFQVPQSGLRGQLSKYHSPCHAVSYPSATVRVTSSAIPCELFSINIMYWVMGGEYFYLEYW